MNLDLEKKYETLNLTKAEPKLFDTLQNKRLQIENSISEENLNFIEKKFLPQIFEFNSIGFTMKDFLLIKNDKFYYSSKEFKSVHKKTLIKLLKEMGFDAYFYIDYDFKNLFCEYLSVSWSNLLKSVDCSEIIKKIKKEHNSFNTSRYSLVKKDVDEILIPQIQKLNNSNITELTKCSDISNTSIFDKLIVLEILKKEGIFARIDKLDNFNLSIYWDKTIEEYSKTEPITDAKYFEKTLISYYNDPQFAKLINLLQSESVRKFREVLFQDITIVDKNSTLIGKTKNRNNNKLSKSISNDTYIKETNSDINNKISQDSNIKDTSTLALSFVENVCVILCIIGLTLLCMLFVDLFVKRFLG